VRRILAIARELDTRGQLVRYVIAGVFNTVVTYALLVLAMEWLQYLIAYSIVYVLGIAIGYWLQSRFVFRVPVRWRSAAQFPVVYVFQYVLGASILWALIRLFQFGPRLAALFTVAVTVPAGFLMSRRVLAGPARHAHRR
jgi:putative flippase GtrA